VRKFLFGFLLLFSLDAFGKFDPTNCFPVHTIDMYKEKGNIFGKYNKFSKNSINLINCIQQLIDDMDKVEYEVDPFFYGKTFTTVEDALQAISNNYSKKLEVNPFAYNATSMHLEDALDKIGETMVKVENNLSSVAVYTFDYSYQPLTGTHTFGSKIPKDSYVKDVWIDVLTTFASDDTTPDSTTIEVKLLSSGDVVAPVAINDGSNPWDAGVRGALVDPSDKSSWLKPSAGSNVEVVVTNGAGVTNGLTAGRLVVYVEYFN
jgi:hypothetical protein